NPALLTSAGVSVILSTFGGFENRLSQNAGIAVANGMPYHHALNAITKNPATLLQETSSLDVFKLGGPATFTLWDNDPFEPRSTMRASWIAGKAQNITTRMDVLAKRYYDKIQDAKRSKATAMP